MLEKHLALYKSLRRNRVEYLIIGGIACGIYGSPRATRDLDIFIRPNLENAARLLTALKETGFGTTYLTTPSLKGVGINVVSLDGLISSKRASSRLIDKEDIKILKTIRKQK